MHMDLKSAYFILKVDFLTSLPLVTKAYKKLALKFHPDKCKDVNSQEKFTEIQKAYEYIKKNAKSDGSRNLFEDSSKNETPQQPEPNEFEVTLTLEEVFSGCTRKEQITVKVVDANGIEKRESKTLNFEVKPGQIAGSRIKIDKQGDRYQGKIPADVVFMVREEAHKLFKRIRFDLEYTAKLTTEQACSRRVEVPTIDGRSIKLTINQIITQSTVEKVPNRGLPVPNGNGKRGDFIVKFDIIYEKDKKQDPPIEHNISLTLEQILQGCTKKIRIRRSIIDSFNGYERNEDKILTIAIPPGVKSGTKFTFPKEGDQRPDTIPADVIFTIQQKTHSNFIRNGSDLKYTALISEDEARNGCTVDVPTLDGDTIPLVVNISMAFNFKIFPDRGMPKDGNLNKRGNLIIKFKVLENHHVDKPIENILPLTLENILHGCTKKLKIQRLIIDKDDNEVTENKILTINIKPGTESGTIFRFARMGDKYPDKIAADLVFITSDKPNDTFTRNGADVEFTAKLTRYQLSSGGKIDIPTLEGGTVKLSLDGILKPTATVKRFSGHGLPFCDNLEKRGNLVVRFEIIGDSNNQVQQDPPVEHNLFLTDEQMTVGCTKRVNIHRSIIDSNGNERNESKILTIEVKPGTCSGEKILFEKEGDIRPGCIPANIIFIVRHKSSKASSPKPKSQYLPQDPPIEHDLPLSLENILYGCTKRMKIKRTITDSDGNKSLEELIIPIIIPPGTEEGEKFVFSQMGDKNPESIPADIVFIVRDKPHDKFTRKGVNLEYSIKIDRNSMFQILEIPTLEDEIVNLTFTSLNRHEKVRIIPQRGLPYPNDHNNQRGDIVVCIVSN